MGNIHDEVSVGYIRCTHCGTTYKVSGDELYEEDLTYHCHNCIMILKFLFLLIVRNVMKLLELTMALLKMC